MPKPTKHISARRTRESLRAGRHAYKVAQLNVLLTVVFEELPGQEYEPQRQISDFLARFRSWTTYRRKLGQYPDIPPVWHLVFENTTKLHAHISLHVPVILLDSFRKAYPQWQLRTLPGTSIHERDIPNTNGLMRYLHKGVDPYQANRFDIRPSDQGTVWGPRVRAARCLGPAARERFLGG